MRHVFLKGVNADHARFLAGKGSDTQSLELFKSYAQLYTYCAVYGCCKGQYYQDKIDDNSSNMVEIRPEYFSKDNLAMYRKIVLLAETVSGRTDAEKIDAVFKYDDRVNLESSDPIYDIIRKNDEIIERFAIGGLNSLYLDFHNLEPKDDESKKSIVRMLQNMISDLSIDNNLVEDEFDDDEFDERYA